VNDDDEPLPEVMELRPDRLKWVVIFLLAMGFVSIAIWLGQDMNALTRWGSGGFFALCGLIAVPQMIGVGARLRLDAEGFTCSTLFRSFRRTWAECSVFAPVRIGLTSMVGFSTQTDEARHPGGAAVARSLTGHSGALPDTFGMSADDLSDLMNLFRLRALAAKDTP
jgi:hypothetical protein